jgi:hypothetical protein
MLRYQTNVGGHPTRPIGSCYDILFCKSQGNAFLGAARSASWPTPRSVHPPPTISLSWSPDGRQLLYAGMDGMHFLNPENGETRSLTSRSSAI